MRLVAMAVVAAFAVGAVSIADAAPRKKEVAMSNQDRDRPSSRPRMNGAASAPKILVQKRSYLDGGTEVMPGDIQSHQTNFIDMQQNPRSAVSNDNIVPGRPINDPFFLRARTTPTSASFLAMVAFSAANRFHFAENALSGELLHLGR